MYIGRIENIIPNFIVMLFGKYIRVIFVLISGLIVRQFFNVHDFHRVRDPPKEVVVRLRARFGNHLFQLTSAMGIARHHNASLCFIRSHFQTTSVDSLFHSPPFRACSLSTKLMYYTSRLDTFREDGHCMFSMPKAYTSTLVVGQYLQSYKYFENIDVVSLYHIKAQYALQAENIIQNSIQEQRDVQTIGIHVRRTDQLTAGFLNVPPAAYFIDAMEYFVQKYKHVHFFVLSDDITWCKRQDMFTLQNNVSFVETKSMMVDFTVLAKCMHVVISVGTFGWWGAFLGPHSHGGEVVYYNDEFNMQHKLNIGTVVSEDYYPPTWKCMAVSLLE